MACSASRCTIHNGQMQDVVQRLRQESQDSRSLVHSTITGSVEVYCLHFKSWSHLPRLIEMLQEYVILSLRSGADQRCSCTVTWSSCRDFRLVKFICAQIRSFFPRFPPTTGDTAPQYASVLRFLMNVNRQAMEREDALAHLVREEAGRMWVIRYRWISHIGAQAFSRVLLRNTLKCMHIKNILKLSAIRGFAARKKERPGQKRFPQLAKKRLKQQKKLLKRWDGPLGLT